MGRSWMTPQIPQEGLTQEPAEGLQGRLGLRLALPTVYCQSQGRGNLLGKRSCCPGAWKTLGTDQLLGTGPFPWAWLPEGVRPAVRLPPRGQELRCTFHPSQMAPHFFPPSSAKKVMGAFLLQRPGGKHVADWCLPFTTCPTSPRFPILSLTMSTDGPGTPWAHFGTESLDSWLHCLLCH